MRLARLTTAWILTALVLTFGGPGLVAQAERSGPAFTRPAATAQPRVDEHACGEALFGPKELSDKPPFDALFEEYERPTLQPECDDFFAKWGKIEDGKKRWIYPKNNGFEGTPRRTTLEPGRLIDRFGNSTGGFLSPAGDPYRERSLPPTNLNTPANGPQHNYHVYEVVRPFDVDAGRIAAWFSQPGGGVQFYLNPEYKPTDDLQPYNVDYLLQQGFVKEIAPK